MNMKAIATLVLAVFVYSLPLFEQAAGGVTGISGVVRDASGGTVPDAKVVISTDSQGTIRSVITNHDGVFTAPALDPGPGLQ